MVIWFWSHDNSDGCACDFSGCANIEKKVGQWTETIFGGLQEHFEAFIYVGF